MFRYIIRPQLRRVFSWFGHPRLVPGEWGADSWGRCSVHQKTTVGKGINLFGCVWIDEEEGKAVAAYKTHPGQPLQRLVGKDLKQVETAKRQIWEQRGLLTHSDAALWATRILEDPTFGAVVRSEVTRRFSLLIVDELQDTGHFLGKSIRLLLE